MFEMKTLLRLIEIEHDALSYQIGNIEQCLRSMKSPKPKLQHLPVEKSDCDPEQVECDDKKESSVNSETSPCGSKLLVEVESVLAKAAKVIECKEINTLLVRNDIKRPVIKQAIPKPKLINRQENFSRTKTTAQSSSQRRGLKKQESKSNGGIARSGFHSTVENGAMVNGSHLLKRRKRVQAKYRKLSKSIGGLNTLSRGLSYSYEDVFQSTSADDEAYSKFPQLSCIHKILCHIDDSYICPGTFNAENIRTIVKKTNQEFSGVSKQLSSHTCLEVAHALLTNKHRSGCFLDKHIEDKLKVVSFYRSKELANQFEANINLSLLKTKITILNELVVDFKSNSTTNDYKLQQLAKLSLSDRMFIPPIILENTKL